MKDLAIQKLANELSELKKPSQHIKVMMQPVHDTLVDFCKQDDEFAQAVYQGGSFRECMDTVAAGVSSSISDLEAYRRAVQYYFPGADIRVQMSVNLCAGVEGEEDAAPAKPEPVVLDLFDLLGV